MEILGDERYCTAVRRAVWCPLFPYLDAHPPPVLTSSPTFPPSLLSLSVFAISASTLSRCARAIGLKVSPMRKFAGYFEGVPCKFPSQLDIQLSASHALSSVIPTLRRTAGLVSGVPFFFFFLSLPFFRSALFRFFPSSSFFLPWP